MGVHVHNYTTYLAVHKFDMYGNRWTAGRLESQVDLCIASSHVRVVPRMQDVSTAAAAMAAAAVCVACVEVWRFRVADWVTGSTAPFVFPIRLSLFARNIDQSTAYGILQLCKRNLQPINYYNYFYSL